jgi:glucosamine--fructose-6-phosphate aminotransferase (isomerizing)
MCGVVGAIAQRDIVPILLDGLKRLEYRGYDSAGLAVIAAENNAEKKGTVHRVRVVGKVAALVNQLEQTPLRGNLGIAHTRWATHGVPCERNAHPHTVANRVALVHNGIIENYSVLRKALISKGYAFESDTDTEVAAACIYEALIKTGDLLTAVQEAVLQFEGAYALCIMDAEDTNRLIGVRKGSPLVVGLGLGEHFLASDALALQRITQEYIYLEEGDVAELSREQLRIFDYKGALVTREKKLRTFNHDTTDKCGFRHFMLKEIYEQPDAIRATLEGRLNKEHVLEAIFGIKAAAIFSETRMVQIVACGTSYHAGLIARFWLEGMAGLPCQVEIASEFRYRKRVVQPGTLLVFVSQSGETADTLAALRSTRSKGYCGTLSICNVPDSSLVRETDLVFLTNAGPEIGVCSTKAFSTQLVAFLLLTAVLAKQAVPQLSTLAEVIQNCLSVDKAIQQIALRFNQKDHALFLGRGVNFPVVLEGALKLKEISYIHAEAYPAGELKHGPLALVDEYMPVVVLAPSGELLDKIKSNIEEVRARGGELIVFTDNKSGIVSGPHLHVIELPWVDELLAPIAYTIPLQLLAYHVAVLRGTDVDMPRNLAKSVTVE